jgi:hypothetical protein
MDGATMNIIEQIRALSDEEWYPESHDYGYTIATGKYEIDVLSSDQIDKDAARRNAEFICDLRNNCKALAESHDRLLEAAKELRDVNPYMIEQVNEAHRKLKAAIEQAEKL